MKSLLKSLRSCKKKPIHFFLLLLLLTNCDTHQRDLALNHQQKIDSLSSIIEGLKIEIDSLKHAHPHLSLKKVETSKCILFQFKPVGLKINITESKPNFDESTFLSIPAAYTSPTTTIEGVFIREGVMVNKQRNAEINGYVVVSDDRITIDYLNQLTDDAINTTIEKKASIFQQTLLLKDKKIIECSLFGDYKNTRRALVTYDRAASPYILESDVPLTIVEFQEALLEHGVMDAIYLDMGTWSEGWYKDKSCTKIAIGEKPFTNTDKQTNWLVLNK